jgi:hypothetical protein
MKWPRIRSRRTTAVSPWMSIIAREVEFSRSEALQVYHAVAQADYISIVALTATGKIPIVRQYRPAIEAFAWELPAGLVDPGEDPADGGEPAGDAQVESEIGAQMIGWPDRQPAHAIMLAIRSRLRASARLAGWLAIRLLTSGKRRRNSSSPSSCTQTATTRSASSQVR